MTTAIVTSSDANYFSYLLDLLQSIDRHRPNRDLPIYVLDVGLTAEQRADLSAIGASVIDLGWDIQFPSLPSCPGWFRAMVARPFLPKHLPGFDCILQIDADIWLQDWRAIDLMIRGAQDGSLAIVTEINACYKHIYEPQNQFRLFARRCYKDAWGEEVAREMTWIPMRNAGLFALRSDSPLWQAWSQAMEVGLQHNAEPLIDQAALNIAIVKSNAKVHALPSWCNWTCNLALPMYDPSRHLLVEPYLPYEPISAVHQVSLRSKRVRLETTDGNTVEVPLDFASFRAMVNSN